MTEPLDSSPEQLVRLNQTTRQSTALANSLSPPDLVLVQPQVTARLELAETVAQLRKLWAYAWRTFLQPLLCGDGGSDKTDALDLVDKLISEIQLALPELNGSGRELLKQLRRVRALVETLGVPVGEAAEQRLEKLVVRVSRAFRKAEERAREPSILRRAWGRHVGPFNGEGVARKAAQELVAAASYRLTKDYVDDDVRSAFRTVNLGLHVTREEASRKRRRLHKKYHPDVGGDCEQFDKIEKAFDQVFLHIDAREA